MYKKNKVPRINIFNPVLWIKSYFITRKCKFKYEKINMGKLKPPYVILSTHGSIMDYFIAQRITFPHSIYNICDDADIDNYRWFICHMGGWYNNRYSEDDVKLNDIKKAIKRNKIVVLYPEVNMSIDGATGILSDNLASMLKKLNVPVVILNNQGSYLHKPMWNNTVSWNNIQSQLIQICNKDEIEIISVDDLHRRIEDNFRYDDYAWQRNQRIPLSNKNRCMGLEKVLYKCPQCLEENKIVSKGDKIYCASCGKQWFMTDYGDMRAILDDNEYTRIHDWFEYERDCVREEIISGKYSLVSKVRVEEMNSQNKVLLSEAGILWHNSEGFVLKYNGRGKEEEIIKSSSEMYSCYFGFDYKGKGSFIELLIDDKRYYIYPQDNSSVVKIMLATEEIYKLNIRSGVVEDKSNEEVITVEVEELIENEDIIEEENKGKVIAVEYIDDKIVTSEQAQAIREQAQTVETNEVS